MKSAEHWEERYRAGGNSGRGSRGKYAEWKAEVLNDFVLRNRVCSVIEFGCGDGVQLGLYHVREYSGYDVSPTVIARCRKQYAADATKRFRLVSDYAGEMADLAISVDVIFHLLEDDVFDEYMTRLFLSAMQFVAICSSDYDAPGAVGNTRHRRYAAWIERNRPDWECMARIPKRYEDSFQDWSFWRRKC